MNMETLLEACGRPMWKFPLHPYVASNPDDPEGICGKMTYFSGEEFMRRYGSPEEYLRQFGDCVEQQGKPEMDLQNRRRKNESLGSGSGRQSYGKM